jgi:hypothetical protein
VHRTHRNTTWCQKRQSQINPTNQTKRPNQTWRPNQIRSQRPNQTQRPEQLVKRQNRKRCASQTKPVMSKTSLTTRRAPPSQGLSDQNRDRYSTPTTRQEGQLLRSVIQTNQTTSTSPTNPGVPEVQVGLSGALILTTYQVRVSVPSFSKVYLTAASRF